MKGFTMNRFLFFILLSIILHLAMGAALFSGTEMLGNKIAASSLNQTNKEEVINVAPDKPQQISTKSVPLKKPSPPISKKKSKKMAIPNIPKKQNKLPAKKEVKNVSLPVKTPTNKTINTNNNQLNTEGNLPSSPATSATSPNQLSIEKIKKEAEQTASDIANNLKKEIKNKNVETQETDELIDEEDEMIEEPIKEEKSEPSNQENDDAPIINTPNIQKNKDTESKNTDEITPTKQNSSNNIAAVARNNSLPKASSALAARAYTQLKQKEGNPIPKYPKKARVQQWEGDVELVYYVNPVGFVENIYVNRSSGHKILDNEAIRTLSRYHYYPGQEGWVKHLVKFSLDKTSEVKETTSLRTLENKQLE